MHAQTSILYDTSRLRLVASDHVWLSDTPRVPHSRSHGSVGARTATMAAFRLVNRVSRLLGV